MTIYQSKEYNIPKDTNLQQFHYFSMFHFKINRANNGHFISELMKMDGNNYQREWELDWNGLDTGFSRWKLQALSLLSLTETLAGTKLHIEREQRILQGKQRYVKSQNTEVCH
jgi:hypothetical protein